MWFDVRKLLSNADWQDISGMVSDVPIDPALAETPATAPGGMTVGGDALALGAGPPSVPGTTTDPFSPAGMMSPFGIAGGTVPEGFGADTTADTGGATFYSATPGTSDTSETYSPIPGEMPPAATTPTTPAPGSKAGPGTGAGTGAGGGVAKTADRMPMAPTPGAGGGNAVANMFNAMRGLQTAAMGGNPQAMQLMQMIRAMMQQQMMGGGMGMMGGQYNPYMSQFFNPRERMEEMRRRFLMHQRQRMAAASPGTAAAMNPPARGGRHGR
jgi:hypothetical protein